MAEQENNQTWIWAFAGCALFLLLLLCCVGGAGVFFGMKDSWNRQSNLPDSGTAPVTVPPPRTPEPTDPSIPPPPTDPTWAQETPRNIKVNVVNVSGNVGITKGAQCEFTIERVVRPNVEGYRCHAQIMCQGASLYGNQTTGFFPCDLADPPARAISGHDPDTTMSDGDAAFFIDSKAGIVRISDDVQSAHGVYSLEAQILSIE